jgi:hypothetical protein
MNIPGFTAEASLFHGDVRYQSTAEANIYRGIVQPAGSSVFNPDVPVLDIFPPGWGNCLKYVCTTRVVKRDPLVVWRDCNWVSAIC